MSLNVEEPYKEEEVLYQVQVRLNSRGRERVVLKVKVYDCAPPLYIHSCHSAHRCIGPCASGAHNFLSTNSVSSSVSLQRTLVESAHHLFPWTTFIQSKGRLSRSLCVVLVDLLNLSGAPFSQPVPVCCTQYFYLVRSWRSFGKIAPGHKGSKEGGGQREGSELEGHHGSSPLVQSPHRRTNLGPPGTPTSPDQHANWNANGHGTTTPIVPGTIPRAVNYCCPLDMYVHGSNIWIFSVVSSVTHGFTNTKG